MGVFKYTQKIFDKLFPPIKFKKKYFKHKETVTQEDMDKWVEKWLVKNDRNRRNQHGK